MTKSKFPFNSVEVLSCRSEFIRTAMMPPCYHAIVLKILPMHWQLLSLIPCRNGLRFSPTLHSLESKLEDETPLHHCSQYNIFVTFHTFKAWYCVAYLIYATETATTSIRVAILLNHVFMPNHTVSTRLLSVCHKYISIYIHSLWVQANIFAILHSFQSTQS